MSPLARMIEPLAQNYGFLYVELAVYYDMQGSKAKTDDAVSNAVTWMLRFGSTAPGTEYVDAWLARDSGNAVAKKLKAELEKTATAH